MPTDSKEHTTVLIYGANGFTGAHIAQKAIEKQWTVIVAGRNRQAISELAHRLGVASKVFDLSDPSNVDANLAGVSIVLNCAGPFSATVRPMVDACLRSGVHYLDITGEADALEYVHRKHAAANAEGVVLCGGVGFDVVPTDCLAAIIKQALPDADYLAVGADSATSFSQGTLKTIVEGLRVRGLIRRNGKLESVPQGSIRRRIDFGRGPRWAVVFSLGDIVTAYHQTGIPNIEYYSALPLRAIRILRAGDVLHRVWRSRRIVKSVQWAIGRFAKPPILGDRIRRQTWVWAEGRNPAGRTAVAKVRVMGIYEFTVLSAIGVVDLLASRSIPPGAYTPAQLVGPEFLSSIPGVSAVEVTNEDK